MDKKSPTKVEAAPSVIKEDTTPLKEVNIELEYDLEKHNKDVIESEKSADPIQQIEAKVDLSKASIPSNDEVAAAAVEITTSVMAEEENSSSSDEEPEKKKAKADTKSPEKETISEDSYKESGGRFTGGRGRFTGGRGRFRGFRGFRGRG